MSNIYTDSKILHFESKLRDLNNKKVSPPIHIRLKPTNRCNHYCNYCCYRNEKLFLNELFKPRDEIPWNKMKEIIQDLKQMQVKAVTFSGGGEPLFYPYFEKTLKQLLNAKIKIGLLTNGSLLHGTVAKVLAQKASWVRISMDTNDAKSYASIRSINSNEFENVCKNIECFAKDPKRKAQLGINLIVTKENYQTIYAFLKRMKSLGVDHVKVSEVVVSTSRHENKKYHKTFVFKIKQQLEKAKHSLADNNFHIIDKYDYFIENTKYNNKEYTFCPYIQCLTVIGADLNVYCCQDKAYTRKGKIDSIKTKTFKNVWTDPKTQKHLLKLNPGKICQHHCTQHNKNLMLLDYLEADPNHLEFV